MRNSNIYFHLRSFHVRTGLRPLLLSCLTTILVLACGPDGEIDRAAQPEQPQSTAAETGPSAAEGESSSRSTDEGPASLVATLGSALESGDRSKARQTFTEEAWNREENSGAEIVDEGQRGGFKLEPTETRIEGDRALVEADVVAEGEVKDTLFFYAVKQGGEWKLASWDENYQHREHFLAGRLPAHFLLDEMPSSPEMDSMAEKVLEWFERSLPSEEEYAGLSEQKKLDLLDGLAEPPGPYYYGNLPLAAEDYEDPEILAVHWVEGIGRGAVVIGESRLDSHTVYLEKRVDGWHFVTVSSYPSAESILQVVNG